MKHEGYDAICLREMNLSLAAPFRKARMRPRLITAAIYSIIITQITVSQHALDIIPHYDWQYFSQLGT